MNFWLLSEVTHVSFKTIYWFSADNFLPKDADQLERGSQPISKTRSVSPLL